MRRRIGARALLRQTLNRHPVSHCLGTRAGLPGLTRQCRQVQRLRPPPARVRGHNLAAPCGEGGAHEVNCQGSWGPAASFFAAPFPLGVGHTPLPRQLSLRPSLSLNTVPRGLFPWCAPFVRGSSVAVALQDVDHLRDRLDQDLKAYMNEFDTRTTSTLEQLKESVSLDLALEKQYLKAPFALFILHR